MVMNDMENKNTSSTTNEGLKLTNKQILLCMDGDVRYVEEYILPTYLCALIAVIII